MMTMKASDYRIFLDGYYADLYADGSDNNRNYHCTHAIINYLDRMDSGGQSWECLDIGFGRGTLLQYFVERSWTAYSGISAHLFRQHPPICTGVSAQL